MLTFKLWLEEFSPKIVVKRNEYDTLPYIEVLFPNKTRWKYIFPDQLAMNFYLNKYSKNIGRLLSIIKSDKRIEQEQIN